jgi:hemoglobin-like flavoprotein
MTKLRLAQHEGHIFLVRTAMTPSQVSTLRTSFQQLAPSASEAASIFYDELFRLDPELRELFPSDMSPQKNKFVQMLGTVVRCLDNVSSISDHVADLGRRHAAYDVRESDYVTVGKALLAMLRRVLGPEYTAEIQDAWLAVYDMLTRMMQEAVPDAYPAGGFFGHAIRGVMTAQYGVETGLGSLQEPTNIVRGPARRQRARSP